MPQYDFRCSACQYKFETFITYQEYGARKVTCPQCGSANVLRRLNKVRVLRSDMNRLAGYSDPASLNGLDEDPQALGRMMRNMSQDVGEDMPPEFDEVVDRLEKGQSPEDIEKSMPDLGSGLPGDAVDEV